MKQFYLIVFLFFGLSKTLLADQFNLESQVGKPLTNNQIQFMSSFIENKIPAGLTNEYVNQLQSNLQIIKQKNTKFNPTNVYYLLPFLSFIHIHAPVGFYFDANYQSWRLVHSKVSIDTSIIIELWDLFFRISNSIYDTQKLNYAVMKSFDDLVSYSITTLFNNYKMNAAERKQVANALLYYAFYMFNMKPEQSRNLAAKAISPTLDFWYKKELSQIQNAVRQGSGPKID